MQLSHPFVIPEVAARQSFSARCVVEHHVNQSTIQRMLVVQQQG